MVHNFNTLNEFLSELHIIQICLTNYKNYTKLVVHSLFLLLTKICLEKSNLNLDLLCNSDIFYLFVSIHKYIIYNNTFHSILLNMVM